MQGPGRWVVLYCARRRAPDSARPPPAARRKHKAAPPGAPSAAPPRRVRAGAGALRGGSTAGRRRGRAERAAARRAQVLHLLEAVLSSVVAMAAVEAQRAAALRADLAGRRLAACEHVASVQARPLRSRMSTVVYGRVAQLMKSTSR
jgi:hypothetical protein